MVGGRELGRVYIGRKEKRGNRVLQREGMEGMDVGREGGGGVDREGG